MTGEDAPRVHARVTPDPLDPPAALEAARTDADGALLLFVGVVRNHADGRAVTGMRYDAYQDMADEVLGEIAEEAAREMGSPRVWVEHRTGRLAIGEASVVIVSASPHRAESFDAVRYVIEEIKKRLPVWKKEEYVEGDEAGVEGTVPPGTGVGAGVDPVAGTAPEGGPEDQGRGA